MAELTAKSMPVLARERKRKHTGEHGNSLVKLYGLEFYPQSPGKKVRCGGVCL